jgi:hypothetical protein
MDPHAYLNRGIRSLGHDLVLTYVQHLADSYDDCPIVSLGSGMGAIESMFPADVAPRLIYVDPDYGVYRYDEPNGSGMAFRTPDFDTVRDLVATRPEIVGACVLFLDWCHPNASDIDMEAVELLRPRGILAIIERLGTRNGYAGGERFHRLYERAECGDDAGPNRHVLHQQTLVTRFPGCSAWMDIRICWLHWETDERPRPPTFPDLPASVQSKIAHTPLQCRIQ